jgi:hypothetical protein
MLNSTQIQFTNKSSASHISTTSTINNQTTHFVLYIASLMEYVFPSLIIFIFLDLNLTCAPYNQELFNR